MHLIDEAQARERVDLATAIEAVEESFRDLAQGRASLFPAIREKVAGGAGTFGVKSGELARYDIVGLKAGGYWPENAASLHGLDNHQSTTLLFERGSGRALAAVEANWLTEARTAAAGAIGIKALAREESRVLGIVGTGKQAASQVEAACLARHFETIYVTGRSREGAQRLCRELERRGLRALACDMERTVRSADVLITVTPASAPLFPAEWVPPGQHVNAMGADTRGKRELPTELLRSAVLVYDDALQSYTLGELEAVPELARGGVALGGVLTGTAAARTSPDDRTVFDSTGIALQDLAVAAKAAGM